MASLSTMWLPHPATDSSDSASQAGGFVACGGNEAADIADAASWTTLMEQFS